MTKYLIILLIAYLLWYAGHILYDLFLKKEVEEGDAVQKAFVIPTEQKLQATPESVDVDSVQDLNTPSSFELSETVTTEDETPSTTQSSEEPQELTSEPEEIPEEDTPAKDSEEPTSTSADETIKVDKAAEIELVEVPAAVPSEQPKEAVFTSNDEMRNLFESGQDIDEPLTEDDVADNDLQQTVEHSIEPIDNQTTKTNLNKNKWPTNEIKIPKNEVEIDPLLEKQQDFQRIKLQGNEAIQCYINDEAIKVYRSTL